MTSQVSFAVLGPLEMTQSARRVLAPNGKQRVLLASLLLHPNQIVPVHFLHRSMWGEQQPSNPQKALATCMTRLRQRLGLVSHAAADSIETTVGGYELSVGADGLDLIRFRQANSNAGSAAAVGDVVGAGQALDEALSLWRGPVLPDVDSEFLHANVLVGLEEERLLAIERRQTVHLLSGRHEDIIAELQTLVQENPTRERFWQHLMLALHRTGRTGEALEAHQTVSRYLRDEFGTDPGEELTRVHLAILHNDVTLKDPAYDTTWLPGAAWIGRG